MGEQTGVTTTTEEIVTQDDFEPITSQEALDKIVQKRLARSESKYADYDDLKAKAARVDELESAKLTELEKAQKVADEAIKAKTDLEAQIRARDVELLRQKIGVEAGLPVELIARLQGEDEDTIREDAKTLSAVIPEPRRSIPNTWDRPKDDVSVDASFASELFGS